MYWTLLAYRTKNFYNLHKNTKASKVKLSSQKVYASDADVFQKNRPRASNVSADLNIIEKTDTDIAVTDANDTH